MRANFGFVFGQLKKRRKIGRPKPTAKDDKMELLAIKMALRQSLRPGFCKPIHTSIHTSKPIMQLVDKYYSIATKKTFHASRKRRIRLRRRCIFAQKREHVIRDCFLSVLNEERHHPNSVWPTHEGMGNAFNSRYEQYTMNVKNNLKVQYVARIRVCLRMRCFEMNRGQLRSRKPADIVIFDEVDIKNATELRWKSSAKTAVFTGRSHMNQQPMRFVTIHWFASIQRHITHFHTAYSYLKFIY